MSLRIAPLADHKTSTVSVRSAPSAPGLPDTLRNKTSLTQGITTSSDKNPGQTSLPHLSAPAPSSSHPLETRLTQWRSTQHALKMTGLRRTFGMAEPVRRGMELAITRGGEWRPAVLGGSEGVSGDVLEGRDWSLEWEDIYDGGRRDGLAVVYAAGGQEEGGGMSGEVEARVGMERL